MKKITKCIECRQPRECRKSGHCLAVASALGMFKPAAPSGTLVVATGSLPVSEAEALSQLWMGRSLKCLAIAREDDKAGRDTLAWCNHVRSAAYLLCADELRQRAGLPTSRQPEENVAGLPTRDERTANPSTTSK